MPSAANQKTSHKHNDVAAKAKAAPAAGADDGGRPCDGCGMLHTMFTNEKTSQPYLQATAAAARRLRQLVRPTLPLALAGVRHTWLMLDEHGLRGAWDMHVTIAAPAQTCVLRRVLHAIDATPAPDTLVDFHTARRRRRKQPQKPTRAATPARPPTGLLITSDTPPAAPTGPTP